MFVTFINFFNFDFDYVVVFLIEFDFSRKIKSVVIFIVILMIEFASFNCIRHYFFMHRSKSFDCLKNDNYCDKFSYFVRDNFVQINKDFDFALNIVRLKKYIK